VTPAPDAPVDEDRGLQVAAGCGACVGGGLIAAAGTMLLPLVEEPFVNGISRDVLQIGSPCSRVALGAATGAVLFTAAAAGTGATMVAVERERHPDVDPTATILVPAGVAVVGATAAIGAAGALGGSGNYDVLVAVPIGLLAAVVTSPFVVWSAWGTWGLSVDAARANVVDSTVVDAPPDVPVVDVPVAPVDGPVGPADEPVAPANGGGDA
jgi:hypothetical protein